MCWRQLASPPVGCVGGALCSPDSCGVGAVPAVEAVDRPEPESDRVWERGRIDTAPRDRDGDPKGMLLVGSDRAGETSRVLAGPPDSRQSAPEPSLLAPAVMAPASGLLARCLC